ncbi:TetR/AcrR family transcriptional regulator [Ureibacillus aquaedulcis]|uniref:TetR/AcrR family transcriptional regulator n=1 Tax=Ureibacillus aquaedulcis TaxID=3058421 RepID=A0ABT8GQ90_9BACL|nr:TetR/AcrR family transcriptional regulator [Ureibacillus sp. BA0131]MDN4493583.1 TetR/AcrR family transcriptional regulator [Ureibacillus sp. BA0131]
MVQDQVRKHDRKQQLLQIALELFATKGYENTKISDIVSKAEVSQGTFYWHFESKEAICLEMLESGRLQILEAIRIGYRTTRVDVQDSVVSSMNIFEHIFKFAEENPFLMQLILKGIHSQATLQSKVDKIKTDMEAAFANNIRQAKELHMTNDHINPEMLAVFVMSLLEGVLSRWLFKSASSSRVLQHHSLQEIIEETVKFEFFGIFGM